MADKSSRAQFRAYNKIIAARAAKEPVAKGASRTPTTKVEKMDWEVTKLRQLSTVVLFESIVCD